MSSHTDIPTSVFFQGGVAVFGPWTIFKVEGTGKLCNSSGFGLTIQSKFLLQPPFLTRCSIFIWCLLWWWIYFSQVNFKLTPPRYRLCPAFQSGYPFQHLTWRENSEYRFRISGAYYKRGQKRICSIFHREIENNHTHTHILHNNNNKNKRCLMSILKSQGMRRRALPGKVWEAYGQNRQGLLPDSHCMPHFP